MGNDCFVLDTNVFLEYIYDRVLKENSKQILQDAILRKIQLLIPSLLLDEITEVLCGNLDNLIEVKRHLEFIEKLCLRILQKYTTEFYNIHKREWACRKIRS